ncbi:hypothetical protein GCM10028785_24720 [Hydrogenophaga soli]
MPGTLTTYKVFIASAGGLDDFRSAFREIVEHYNSTEAYHRGYMFMPVGWEDTTTGFGRPQALINEDLKQCDFSLFMFRNRWGTPPSVNGPHSSGTEEEWELATEIHRQGSMRDIQGCFFPFIPCNTPEEMAQRTRVEAFKQKLEREKQFFFKSLRQESDFRDWLRTQLSHWLRLIEQEAQQREEAKRQFLTQERSASTSKPKSGDGVHALVHQELMGLLNTDQYSAALSIVNVLLKLAQTPGDTAEALLIKGFIHGQLSQHADAFSTYDELLRRVADAPEPALREQVAEALFNKGVAQGKLQQPEAEIATYDELLRRFADAPEPALRESVAKALVNKGVTQSQLQQPEAAIATCDELLRRFADAPEPALREQVAEALFNKGVAQGKLQQPEAAIATCDELLRRFADAPEPALRESVAKALVNKGVAQGQLQQPGAEIATYDELLRRFADAPEPALGEQVANALFNKGFAQGQLNQPEAVIATYDELLRRFADASEYALRELVAKALFGKGLAQSQLQQHEAEIATYDDLLRRFADAPEPALRELVAHALVTKGAAQGQLQQHEAEIATYDELLRRFADAPETALREQVASALNGRGFTRLMLAKRQGLNSPTAGENLQAALADFSQAAERTDPPSGMVLGNRAYAHQLLGDVRQADQDFAAALHAPNFGGQTLYDATLADLAMHPIPEDAAMRERVERAWAAYQREQGTQPPSPPAVTAADLP